MRCELILVPVELTKVKVRHARIRSENIQGYGIAREDLRPGLPFVMFAQPLDANFTIRRVNTSPIVDIELDQNGSCQIFTRSGSIYHLNYAILLDWSIFN